MAKKRPSLVETIQAIPKRRRLRWDEKVPPNVLADLLEVRAGIISGEIKQSLREIVEAVNEYHSIDVSYGSFQVFIQQGRTDGSG